MEEKTILCHQELTKLRVGKKAPGQRKRKTTKRKEEKGNEQCFVGFEKVLFIMILMCLTIFLFIATPMAINSDSTVRNPKTLQRRGPAYLASASINVNIKEQGNREVLKTKHRALKKANLKEPLSGKKGLHLGLSYFHLSDEEILSDKLDRLANEFDVPQDLKQRIHFWFNIYSKYNPEQHVIHHRKYPWIVYDVVDTRPLLNQKNKTYRQSRREAKYLVWSRKKQVMQILKDLQYVKKGEKIYGRKAEIRSLLSQLPGRLQTHIKESIQLVRTQSGQRRDFFHGLIRSSAYMAHMEKIFADRGLPRELVRIPMVESSFNYKAKSYLGAMGVWQIMPRVGKHYYMQVNHHIDERKSPLKATEVAAHLLKQNYRILKGWPLAVTAYNHGVGSLRKAVHKLKTHDLAEIIRRNDRPSFQFASSNFYACFLAALYAEAYKDKIFYNYSIHSQDNLQLHKYSLKKRAKVRFIVRHLGMEMGEFLDLNTDILKVAYRRNILLPKGFELFIPKRDFMVLDRHKKKLFRLEEDFT